MLPKHINKLCDDCNVYQAIALEVKNGKVTERSNYICDGCIDKEYRRYAFLMRIKTWIKSIFSCRISLRLKLKTNLIKI
jgi:hypothetical protein